MMPHLLFALLSASPAIAQPADMPARPNARVQAAPRPCSMDALPPTEKRRMISEYQRRQRVDGRASADAWATEEGNRFRRHLVAEGVCPPLTGKGRQTAQARKPAGKKPLLNGQGKTCENVGVENRVVPSFGGAPMTMALVPVCKD
jgi:hypothetical protein